jgi:hypothetical protein
LRYPKEKVCPQGWIIMTREEMGSMKRVGLEKRRSSRRRCVSGMDVGQGENGGKNVFLERRWAWGNDGAWGKYVFLRMDSG